MLALSIEQLTPQLMKEYSSLLRNNNPVDEKVFLLSFRPDGKPYKTQAESFKNIKKIVNNPSLAASCVYGAHPSQLKQQAQIEKAEVLKQQKSIKNKKDKEKVRKANKLKRKQKR